MVKKILIAFAALILIILIAASLQPSEYSVERSMMIATPVEIPFAKINDFHKWSEFSPWEELDPTMKRTFEGPESGVGSIYSWEGNKEVGKGKMTITESVPGNLVRLDLEFIEPWAGKNVTEFRFIAEGAQTTVTWKMSGKNEFIGKIMCMFMSMDKMIGGDFEKGLTKLKAASEAQAALPK